MGFGPLKERVIRGQKVIFWMDNDAQNLVDPLRLNRVFCARRQEKSRYHIVLSFSLALALAWRTSDVVRIRDQELPNFHSQFRREPREVAEPYDAVVERRRLWRPIVEYALSFEITDRVSFTLSKRLVPVEGRGNCVLKSQVPLENPVFGAPVAVGTPWTLLTGDYIKTTIITFTGSCWNTS